MPGPMPFLSQADIDQLKRIMEVVGTPSPEVLAKISSEHVSHQPRGLCCPGRGAWRKGLRGWTRRRMGSTGLALQGEGREWGGHSWHEGQ